MHAARSEKSCGQTNLYPLPLPLSPQLPPGAWRTDRARLIMPAPDFARVYACAHSRRACEKRDDACPPPRAHTVLQSKSLRCPPLTNTTRARTINSRRSPTTPPPPRNHAPTPAPHLDADHLRLLLDAVPAPVACFDAEERYRFTNRAHERWFGRPRAELYGRSLREVFGPEPYEELRPLVALALAGERTT